MAAPVCALILLGSAAAARAGSPDDIEFFNQEAKVVIATQHEQTPEQAPSIVSVITRHDIEAYGARDVADILRLVPGFEFGMDVYSQAGLTSRGISVEEGKSLMMINGLTQNELGFGNFNFFGAIPASMIERVEIIRGPGSAIYGGFAEVDVINVVTFQGGNLNGIRVSGDAGAVGSGGTSRSGDVSFGAKTDAVSMAVHVGYGTQPLSTREYDDFFGNRLGLNQNNASRQWQHVVAEASAKNLTVRYQRTSFTYGGQDTFTTIQPPVNGGNAEYINNYDEVGHVDYRAKLTDRLTLQPLFEYTRNNTWTFPSPSSIDAFFEGPSTLIQRYHGELTVVYQAPWSAEIRAGGGYIRDEVHGVAADGTPGLQLSSDPSNLSDHGHTASTFGLLQYLQQFDLVGLTVGGRYEDTTFGNAFAPRVGLTYAHEAFNAKLLYGRAFRIPMAWEAYSRNLGFNPALKPETADTTEAEVGYRLAPQVTSKFNVFFIDIHEPITYEGATNSYVNLGRIQSQGAEAEIRADYVRYGGFANLSYAVPGGATSSGFATQSKKQFLGTPPVKIDVGSYYRLGLLEFGPSATYLSQRAGQSSESANSPSALSATREYGALVLFNFNIVARNVLKDLDLHLGVHNLFDSRYLLIQPYYGDHAPMPAQDREIDLGFTWRL